MTFTQSERDLRLIQLVEKGLRFDKTDWKLVRQYTWTLVNGYAMTGGNVYMHNLFLGPTPEGMETDHKDRNRLNNRRSNIHFVTPLQNRMNSDRWDKLHPKKEPTDDWVGFLISRPENFLDLPTYDETDPKKA